MQQTSRTIPNHVHTWICFLACLLIFCNCFHSLAGWVIFSLALSLSPEEGRLLNREKPLKATHEVVIEPSVRWSCS